VDFLSYPFIIAYPFIREVRVPNKRARSLSISEKKSTLQQFFM
jgi:hypothetical protein